nr:hypothetical protein [Tanacetum cinerariifolium]
MLSTWRPEEDDCCQWLWVTCNNQTGHVTELQLDGFAYNSSLEALVLMSLLAQFPSPLGNKFSATIPQSIRSLTKLTALYLSWNKFSGTIPMSIGYLTKLTWLELSNNSFYGTIPREFGNLTNLEYLNLDFLGSCRVENLDWLSSLSSLEVLIMDGISLAKTNNLVNVIIVGKHLECLCLYSVTLDDDMIEKILSGSPCLESLELIDCYGYTRIDVTSKSVNKLVFSKHYSDDELFEKDYIDHITINAPYISSLAIKGEFVFKLVLLDVSSLIKAELDYSIDPGMFEINHKEILRGLLESLDHVKDVIINDFWWEFYSHLKARGGISNGCSVMLKT